MATASHGPPPALRRIAAGRAAQQQERPASAQPRCSVHRYGVWLSWKRVAGEAGLAGEVRTPERKRRWPAPAKRTGWHRRAGGGHERERPRGPASTSRRSARCRDLRRGEGCAQGEAEQRAGDAPPPGAAQRDANGHGEHERQQRRPPARRPGSRGRSHERPARRRRAATAARPSPPARQTSRPPPAPTAPGPARAGVEEPPGGHEHAGQREGHRRHFGRAARSRPPRGPSAARRRTPAPRPARTAARRRRAAAGSGRASMSGKEGAEVRVAGQRLRRTRRRDSGTGTRPDAAARPWRPWPGRWVIDRVLVRDDPLPGGERDEGASSSARRSQRRGGVMRERSGHRPAAAPPSRADRRPSHQPQQADVDRPRPRSRPRGSASRYGGRTATRAGSTSTAWSRTARPRSSPWFRVARHREARRSSTRVARESGAISVARTGRGQEVPLVHLRRQHEERRRTARRRPAQAVVAGPAPEPRQHEGGPGGEQRPGPTSPVRERPDRPRVRARLDRRAARAGDVQAVEHVPAVVGLDGAQRVVPDGVRVRARPSAPRRGHVGHGRRRHHSDRATAAAERARGDRSRRHVHTARHGQRHHGQELGGERRGRSSAPAQGAAVQGSATIAGDHEQAEQRVELAPGRGVDEQRRRDRDQDRGPAAPPARRTAARSPIAHSGTWATPGQRGSAA